MPLTAETKKEVIEKYKLSDQDTGSAEVQVALLSERINSLMDHFDSHKKDHHFQYNQDQQSDLYDHKP